MLPFLLLQKAPKNIQGIFICVFLLNIRGQSTNKLTAYFHNSIRDCFVEMPAKV